MRGAELSENTFTMVRPHPLKTHPHFLPPTHIHYTSNTATQSHGQTSSHTSSHTSSYTSSHPSNRGGVRSRTHTGFMAGFVHEQPKPSTSRQTHHTFSSRTQTRARAHKHARARALANTRMPTRPPARPTQPPHPTRPYDAAGGDGGVPPSETLARAVPLLGLGGADGRTNGRACEQVNERMDARTYGCTKVRMHERMHGRADDCTDASMHSSTTQTLAHAHSAMPKVHLDAFAGSCTHRCYPPASFSYHETFPPFAPSPLPPFPVFI